MLPNKIASILQNDARLQPGALLLAGVSGGPDSICLLHILQRLGYTVIAAHLNHKLRPEADEEAEKVHEFAGLLGVKYVTDSVDVASYSNENSVSIEDAARILRYRFLFEQAKLFSAGAVVVGHNADDQVETILMHLLRGSGLAGLKGMEIRSLPNPWSDEIPMIRPLLFTWRSEIRDYLIENGLKTSTDQSNLDTKYTRNRIRHELIPVLENYNPQIKPAVLRMGQTLKEDYSILHQLTLRAWEAILLSSGPGYLSFSEAGFRQISPALQRYCLREAISAQIPGLHDVDFDCIDRGVQFISSDSSASQIDLIAGLRLRRETDDIWLVSGQAEPPSIEYPSMPAGTEIILTIPSTLALDQGWLLEVELIEYSQVDDRNIITHNTDLYQAWMDIECLEGVFVLRTRRPGDTIRALGMNGQSMKISDLMINLKLPRRVRASLPLVCMVDEVVWVPGLKISHRVQVTPDTSRLIHFRLYRASSS